MNGLALGASKFLASLSSPLLLPVLSPLFHLLTAWMFGLKNRKNLIITMADRKIGGFPLLSEKNWPKLVLHTSFLRVKAKQNFKVQQFGNFLALSQISGALCLH